MHAVFETRRPRRDPALARNQFQELVRRLDENARAVAGIGLATAGAAVIQVQQYLQRLLNDGMGLPALDVDHEAYAAGLMFKLRVVQALFGRRTGLGRALAIASTVCLNCHAKET